MPSIIQRFCSWGLLSLYFFWTIVQLTLLVLLRTDFFTITASLGCWLNVFLLLKSPHINWISFCIQWSVLRTIISYWSYHWVVSSAACTTGLSFQMRKNRTPFAHHLSYTGLLTYFTLITTEYGLLGFWWSRPSCLCLIQECKSFHAESLPIIIFHYYWFLCSLVALVFCYGISWSHYHGFLLSLWFHSLRALFQLRSHLYRVFALKN